MSNRYENLRREEFPLRSSRTGDIIQVLQQILSTQQAYKIVIEGDRIVSYKIQTQEGLEESDVTLDGALRNSTLIEYTNDEYNAFETVLDMMQIVANEDLHPICWATGFPQERLLESWLRLEARGMQMPVDPMDSLACIPIHRLKTLPEDALILCATKHSDADVKDVVLGVKAAIFLRRPEVVDEDQGQEPSREADSPVGDDSEGDAGADGAVETPAGRDVGGSWVPPRFGFSGMGDGE